MKRRPGSEAQSAAGGRRRQEKARSGGGDRLAGVQRALGNRTFGGLLAGGGPVAAAPKLPELTLHDPAVPEPSQVRVGSSTVLTVYFAYDSSFLDVRHLRAVMKLGQYLRILDEPTVWVNGHASTEGKPEYNQALSERRRNLVVALLQDDFELVNPDGSIGGRAYGEDKPQEAESGEGAALEEQRARNRRVEIGVMGPPWSLSPDGEKPADVATPDYDLSKPVPSLTLEQYREIFGDDDLLRPPPKIPQRKKRSLGGLQDEGVKNVVEDILDGIGVNDPTVRKWTVKGVKAGVRAGEKKAMGWVIDQAPIGPRYKEGLKKVFEASIEFKILGL